MTPESPEAYHRRVLELKLENNQDLLNDVSKERVVLDQRWSRLQDERQLIIEGLRSVIDE
jgi:hypothetical protein